MLASIVFLGNEFVIPTHDGVRGKQYRALVQHLSAESFCLGRHPHSLLIGEQNPFVLFFLLFNQYPDLFSEIINRLVELFVNAVG